MMITVAKEYADGRVDYYAIQSDITNLPIEGRTSGSKCSMLDTNKDYILVTDENDKNGYWDLMYE